ncbi:hypothetical protein M5K25_017482 [Dendrobium thyrsiflorum]|uniref:Uncharacterized protein n=1 Tax=Dendrobium thyrsiflorum TaxID=117978 RepID=A0ABD0UU75_DENTH
MVTDNGLFDFSHPPITVLTTSFANYDPSNLRHQTTETLLSQGEFSKRSKAFTYNASTPLKQCMADPDLNSGFTYDEQGFVDILRSPFFDVNLAIDNMVEEYVERIIFTLSNVIEEHISNVQWTIIAKPPQGIPSPTCSITSSTELCSSGATGFGWQPWLTGNGTGSKSLGQLVKVSESKTESEVRRRKERASFRLMGREAVALFEEAIVSEERLILELWTEI